MRYQETWIGGPTDDGFQRECAPRYDVIKELLDRFNRPFSVFDFGANMGYFTFRSAGDFKASTFIAVDKHKELVSLAQQNALPNVIAIARRMSGTDLLQLAESETVDVVLALNVLHHMEDWEAALAGLRVLGRHVLVETPGPGDTGAVGANRHAAIYRVVSSIGTELARFKAHTTDGAERVMFLLDGEVGKRIEAQTLDSEERGAPDVREMVVKLDFDKATIQRDGEASEYVPGMNLWNAHLLGAGWPTNLRKRIKREVERLAAEDQWHDDLRPWNFIISGKRAVAIDMGNKKRSEPEKNGLSECLSLLA